MVLELHVPRGASLHVLRPLVPVALSYLLSFVILGIYWNNHHHMLQATTRVNGAVLWANLHLLFWLSLFPFATGFMGENHFATVPTICYGVVLLAAAFAYYLLKTAIIAAQGQDSTLAVALGRDLKGKASPVIYLVAIAAGTVERWAAVALYVVVALMWLVPDRRVESRLNASAVAAADPGSS